MGGEDFADALAFKDESSFAGSELGVWVGLNIGGTNEKMIEKRVG